MRLLDPTAHASDGFTPATPRRNESPLPGWLGATCHVPSHTRLARAGLPNAVAAPSKHAVSIRTVATAERRVTQR
jgi:hypothetical protein